MKIARLALILLVCAAAAAGAAQRSVQVREAEVRQSPSFLGGITGVLEYGDRVELLNEQGGWSEISAPDKGLSGWVHTSALTKKRIVLEAGEEDVETGASETEVALAGRGFNEAVENRYESRQGLDYTWVDRMEQEHDYDTGELVSFLREAGLEATGGAE